MLELNKIFKRISDMKIMYNNQIDPEPIINSTHRINWKEYNILTYNYNTFITRYYHYLRIMTTHKYFHQIISRKKITQCLDIGCSGGYFSRMVAENNIFVDAIDSDLLSSENDFPYIHYMKINIEDFTYNKKYDLILFCEVLEHIPVENRPMVLEKIYDLLAEDGILFFSGPNCFSFLYGAGYCKEKFVNFFKGTTYVNWHYHIPFFSYKNTFESSGFVIDEWCTNGIFPVILNQMEKFIGKFVWHLILADNNLSKILRGGGANYYCIARKKPKHQNDKD